MLIILAPLVGLFLLWLMFRLATYALPFAVGTWSAFWLLHHGNGYMLSILGGFALAVIVLAIGQFLFDTVRSPALRVALGPSCRHRGVQSDQRPWSAGRRPRPGIDDPQLGWRRGYRDYRRAASQRRPADRKSLNAAACSHSLEFGCGREAGYAFLQVDMKLLRGFPCRCLASACFEQSSDLAVRATGAFPGLAATALGAGAVAAALGADEAAGV
nr:hypothetical protein [Sphingomonas lycopersici]